MSSVYCPHFFFFFFFLVLNIAELDALEADMEFESAAVPSYLQPDEESDLNLPAAPTYPAAVPASRHQVSGFHVHLHCRTKCNSHSIFNLAQYYPEFLVFLSLGVN
jgi:hypothetical protein